LLCCRCAVAGDIYLGNYEGWYDEREETFISEKDAELTDFKVRVTLHIAM
jgi:methionyl-tRNA synthetase